MKNTPLFLRYLTDQMHERVPGSLVLWYDSVVENGQLRWQNELNESNRWEVHGARRPGRRAARQCYRLHDRMFFDACDGFFTNYNWTEQSLEWMEGYSVAQSRMADIYVGVDVFARGEVVGGMFETNKVQTLKDNMQLNSSFHRNAVSFQQALKLVRKHQFSVAIFAPGWVYEVHSDKTAFRHNQDK